MPWKQIQPNRFDKEAIKGGASKVELANRLVQNR